MTDKHKKILRHLTGLLKSTEPETVEWAQEWIQHMTDRHEQDTIEMETVVNERKQLLGWVERRINPTTREPIYVAASVDGRRQIVGTREDALEIMSFCRGYGVGR